MRMIFRYMKAYARRIASSMTVKLLGAVTELLIPYILEHLIDEVVPLGQMRQVILSGPSDGRHRTGHPPAQCLGQPHGD